MSDSIYSWEDMTNVGGNDNADSAINWAEGQAPSTVNNSSRAVMARVAEWIHDLVVAKTTGGSSTAYTATTKQSPSTLPDGFTVYLMPHATNTGACTLNVNSLGAKNLRITSGSNAAAGDVVINKPILATYRAATDEYLINAANTSGALKAVVDDTSPQLGGDLDVNGKSIGDGTNELLTFTETASAVNHINITNAVTGSGSTISAAGDDANIDLNLSGKGTGVPKIGGNAILNAGDKASVADYRSNTADKVLITDKVWSSMAEVALTDAASIALDLSTGFDFTVTLGGNRTLANPTNVKAGQRGRIRVVQDGTGSRTLSFGSSYDFADGTAPTLTTTANATDYLDYDCVSASSIRVGGNLNWS